MGEIESFEALLNNGLFFMNQHYLVYPSHPPDPTPIPSNKCLQFDHKRFMHKFTKILENDKDHIICLSTKPIMLRSACLVAQKTIWHDQLNVRNIQKKPIEVISNANT